MRIVLHRYPYGKCATLLKLTLIYWVLCVGVVSSAIAQPNFKWAKNAGAANQAATGLAVAVAPNGNSYAIAQFTGSIKVGPFTRTAQSAYPECLLICYDATGQPQWVKQISSTWGAIKITELSVDESGTIWAAGNTPSTVNVEGMSAAVTTFATHNYCAFVVAFAPDGTPNWAKLFVADNYARTVAKLALDEKNGIGYLAYAVEPYPNNPAFFELIIHRINATGQITASRVRKDQQINPTAVGFDQRRKWLYVAGDYGGRDGYTPPFGGTVQGGSTRPPGWSATDTKFTACLDADLNPRWSVGGADFNVYDLVSDESGSVYGIGNMPGNVMSLGGTTYNVYDGTFPMPGNDMLVYRLTSKGAIKLIKTYGTRYTHDVAYAGQRGSDGQVVVCGYGTLNNTQAGNIVGAIDSTGKRVWERRVSANSNLIFWDVACQPVNNHVLTTGSMQGTISFGAEAGTVTASGAKDMFACKLTPYPVISSFTPNVGVSTAVTNVVISGENFTAATAVTFNGLSASFSINKEGNQISAQVPVGATTGLVRVVTPEGVATSATPFSVYPYTTWTGASSTAWANAANWNAGVPDTDVDALIPAGVPRYPSVSATATARDITIATGATMSLSAGRLTVERNLICDGSFVSAVAVLITGKPNEPRSATISGNGILRLSEWIIAGPTTQKTAVEVSNVITTTKDLTVQASLTLRSILGATAMHVNAGGSIIGDVTVERYISSSRNSGPGYRHISSPVENRKLSDMRSTGPLVVNPDFNTSSTPWNVNPYPTVFSYEESRLTAGAGFGAGWTSPGTLDAGLPAGKSFTMHIPPGTVRISGSLIQRDVTLIGLSRGTQPESGWHLLGNPFAAPLDWSKVPVQAGVEGAMYVYQSSGTYTGNYRSYVNGVGNPFIASMQGFFVRVNTDRTTFTIPQSARATTYVNPVVSRTTADTRPIVNLSLVDNKEQADEASIYWAPDCADTFKASEDARKISVSDLPQLWITAGDASLSINGLPEQSLNVPVPLTVRVANAGVHQLNLESVNALPVGTNVWLEDKQLGLRHNLSQQKTYQFSVGQPMLIGGRFALTLTNQILSGKAADNGLQVALFPNPAHQYVRLELANKVTSGAVKVLISDLAGRVVKIIDLAEVKNNIDVRDFAKGVYLIQIHLDGATIVRRLTVE
ncbi:T9SS C-terminal target domain-containing protein [Hymenobacter oligotrophus]|uniref:T9SS C-terminal target domain-containing protein n=1 Tax=Hymenobacter oligotrophus TaxID=2319843 RepID=A0A3B7R1V5_9BACT|nr:T9SS type A sorting domain-containing protein [Hymenobacter oligotrophus]AYA37403.1 T9SS C-terminal target domain-containing protein [Hymenobacter oligotrophus]